MEILLHTSTGQTVEVIATGYHADMIALAIVLAILLIAAAQAVLLLTTV